MKTNTRGYKDLLVWQKALALAKIIYRITRNFPVAETFGLITQMRRAAVSIPSNIIEGDTTGELIQGISHAEGSVAELDMQLVLSIELMFLRKEEAQIAFESIEEVRRILNVLRRKLSKRG